MKKTISLDEVLEVVVIKIIRCHQIKWCKIGIAIPIISMIATLHGTSKANINISFVLDMHPITKFHISCLAYFMGIYIPLNELINIEPYVYSNVN